MPCGGSSHRSIFAARVRAQQQTRRPPLLLSIDGTDGQTDGRTLDRYTTLTAYYNAQTSTCRTLLTQFIHNRAFSAASGEARGPIYKISYDNLPIMPKLRSTYDGRRVCNTSFEERRVFLRYDSLAESRDRLR